jgi:hypothetical protein
MELGAGPEKCDLRGHYRASAATRSLERARTRLPRAEARDKGPGTLPTLCSTPAGGKLGKKGLRISDCSGEVKGTHLCDAEAGNLPRQPGGPTGTPTLQRKRRLRGGRRRERPVRGRGGGGVEGVALGAGSSQGARKLARASVLRRPLGGEKRTAVGHF